MINRLVGCLNWASCQNPCREQPACTAPGTSCTDARLAQALLHSTAACALRTCLRQTTRWRLYGRVGYPQTLQCLMMNSVKTPGAGGAMTILKDIRNVVLSILGYICYSITSAPLRFELLRKLEKCAIPCKQ